MIVLLLILIIFEIPTCIGWGLIFKKIKLDFKKGIIPFYNKIILIKKYNLAPINLILIFIPLVKLYTNYQIYTKICEKNNKNFIDIIELTLFPFIFNFFLVMELKSEEKEETTNIEENKTIKEDEYVWHPIKKEYDNNAVYKATRNNLGAKVNIKIEKTNEIINNKKNSNKTNPETTKICPNCGTKLEEEREICFVCGTKLVKETK